MSHTFSTLFPRGEGIFAGNCARPDDNCGKRGLAGDRRGLTILNPVRDRGVNESGPPFPALLDHQRAWLSSPVECASKKSKREGRGGTERVAGNKKQVRWWWTKSTAKHPRSKNIPVSWGASYFCKLLTVANMSGAGQKVIPVICGPRIPHVCGGNAGPRVPFGEMQLKKIPL